MPPLIQLTLSCLLYTSLATTGLSADSDPYYVSTVAGREFSRGQNKDGILATLAQLDDPFAVALDAFGNQYITEITGGRIRKVDAITGLISTVAGVGKYGGSKADNIDALSADLGGPSYMILDPQGNIYYTESNGYNRIRKVSATTGIVTTVAGSSRGYEGDNGPATKAKLSYPCGLALDKMGNLYIADNNNDVIRRVDAITGIIITFAGTGSRTFYGENVPAIEAKIAVPSDLAFDASGNLIIADTGNKCIRKVNGVTGYITTLAGTCGKSGLKGDGYDALNSTLSYPRAISYDASGNLYIVDSGNKRIRRVSATSNIIRTVAGSGNDYFNGDSILATTAGMDPSGVIPDKNGNFYVVDRGNDIVRYVSLYAPTSSPTYGVTTSPKPSYEATALPTNAVSSTPSASPTDTVLPPSSAPSASPTTAVPSLSPTTAVSSTPSASPTDTVSPPSSASSASPTTALSSLPSASPTFLPSVSASSSPVSTPSASPSMARKCRCRTRTVKPTCYKPSKRPTTRTTRRPTMVPKCNTPTVKPTKSCSKPPM